MIDSPRRKKGNTANTQKPSKGSSQKRRTEPREVTISKTLSFLLRHGARGDGVELDDGGWANLADVLAWRNIANLSVNLSDIQSIVAVNDKQRFALKRDPSYIPLPNPSSPHSGSMMNRSPFVSEDPAAAYLIRASQGHSLVNISDEKLLTPLLVSDPKTPHLVVHGTWTKPWERIVESGGLRPMSRNHIHFATNVPQDPPQSNSEKPLRMAEASTEPVLSGMRQDATIMIWVDVLKSAEAGVKWWKSDNGVILSEGLNGLMDLRWVIWVERRGTNEILYGTKPPGGAATLQAKSTEDKTNGVAGEGNEAVEGDIEKEVEKLAVVGEERSKADEGGGSIVSGGEDLRSELKDNWDD